MASSDQTDREAKRPRVEGDSEWFVGSIDQGTTSTRFIIFDKTGEPVVKHQIEFENLFPKPGWHEHEPLELLESVETCISHAMEEFTGRLGHAVSQILAIGLTNQRETTVVWDAETGEPLCNAVVWPDTRAASIVRELRAKLEREGLPAASASTSKDAESQAAKAKEDEAHAAAKGGDKRPDAVQARCGLPLSTYPSAVKLLWLLRNVDAVGAAYDGGRLAFGTVDSWLIYKLTAGAVHATDPTNASRTMFMSLSTRDYDADLLAFFGLDRGKIKLPRIVPSASADGFGAVAAGPLKGVSIAGCLGDQSAALVGQCRFSPGQAKNTYGTGCFLLYNVGTSPVISSSGLLATVGYDFSDGQGKGEVGYALEGSIPVAGAGINFLRKNLGLFEKSSDIDGVAREVEDNGGVVFVTAFSGLFAPYWIDDAKGTLFGITSHTTKGHIARATLEATCYQTKAILDAMELDSGRRLESLAVDGGMSDSELCMAFQADLTGIRVVRPAMRETTSLGAAIAAGLAVGAWKGLDEVTKVMLDKPGRTVFEPHGKGDKMDRMFRRWGQAVEMSRGWVRDDHD